VKAGAVIEYSIVAENAVIGENARVGTPPNSMNPDWGISVIAGDVKVGQGAVVPAHAMVTKNVKGAVQK
ncbi:MAG: glucose-1-phosphate adenylyltransferase, partial [Pseudoflavonifractor sp.]